MKRKDNGVGEKEWDVKKTCNLQKKTMWKERKSQMRGERGEGGGGAEVRWKEDEMTLR